jgi:UDP-N-acetyl-D-mannosaminuronate dehydrogenase
MITIIGLGEIGLATYKEISKKEKNIVGVDINKELIQKLRTQGLKVSTKLPKKSDVYIISVYTTEQVLDILEKINCDNNPLIIIESTINPGTIKNINKNCVL